MDPKTTQWRAVSPTNTYIIVIGDDSIHGATRKAGDDIDTQMASCNAAQSFLILLALRCTLIYA